MKISIDRMIFEEFPLARVGWLRASVNVSPECERVKELKKQLAQLNARLDETAQKA